MSNIVKWNIIFFSMYNQKRIALSESAENVQTTFTLTYPCTEFYLEFKTYNILDTSRYKTNVEYPNSRRSPCTRRSSHNLWQQYMHKLYNHCLSVPFLPLYYMSFFEIWPMFTLLVSTYVSYSGALVGFWNWKLVFTTVLFIFFRFSNLLLRFCIILCWFSKRIIFA